MCAGVVVVGLMLDGVLSQVGGGRRGERISRSIRLDLRSGVLFAAGARDGLPAP